MSTNCVPFVDIRACSFSEKKRKQKEAPHHKDPVHTQQKTHEVHQPRGRADLLYVNKTLLLMTDALFYMLQKMVIDHQVNDADKNFYLLTVFSIVLLHVCVNITSIF